jgi:hypothetical protein
MGAEPGGQEALGLIRAERHGQLQVFAHIL